MLIILNSKSPEEFRSKIDHISFNTYYSITMSCDLFLSLCKKLDMIHYDNNHRTISYNGMRIIRTYDIEDSILLLTESTK